MISTVVSAIGLGRTGDLVAKMPMVSGALFIRLGRFKNGAGLLGVEVAEPPQYIEVAEAIQRSQCRGYIQAPKAG